MTNDNILKQLKGGLIVSCQALEDEPLHSSYIMSKMAYAAELGGAVGIRANSVEDIKAIKETVNLPVIGIIKSEYNNSEVYITPTMDEVDRLAETGVQIIATDATKRLRPNNMELKDFFLKVRKKYPNQLFMADTSCFEEGKLAAEIGFDLIGTTMCGYTEYTRETEIPSYPLIEKYAKELNKPIIAEGGIWSPEQLKKVFECGAFSAVVGTAITRPREITKRFTKALEAK